MGNSVGRETMTKEGFEVLGCCCLRGRIFRARDIGGAVPLYNFSRIASVPSLLCLGTTTLENCSSPVAASVC